jgi:hypothetical protein
LRRWAIYYLDYLLQRSQYAMQHQLVHRSMTKLKITLHLHDTNEKERILQKL